MPKANPPQPPKPTRKEWLEAVYAYRVSMSKVDAKREELRALEVECHARHMKLDKLSNLAGLRPAVGVEMVDFAELVTTIAYKDPDDKD